MAKANTYKPLSMPDLSALPDPTADLMGGLTNPSALTRMSREQTEDLLNPKPIANEPFKMSSQARAGLESFAADMASAQNFAAEQAKAQAREEADLLKRSTALTKEIMAANERHAKAVEKANKEAEKAAASGATAAKGAGEGGKFLFEDLANAINEDEAFKQIVSSAERRDVARAKMLEQAEYLRSRGVAEPVIEAELRAGEARIRQLVEDYKKEMHKDGTGVFDFVWGGFSTVSNNILKSVAGMLGAHGVAEQAQSNIDYWKSWMSDEKRLDDANNDYIMAKVEAEGDGIVDTYTRMMAEMATNDEVDITAMMANQWAYFLAGAGAGRAITAGARALGSTATKLTGVTADKLLANVSTTSLTGRALRGVASAEFLGASLASGALVASDAAGGAYDAVMGTNINTLRDNYIKNYSEGGWNAVEDRFGGDEKKIKEYLATASARDAGALGFGLGVLTGATGVESMLGRMFGSGLAADAGKRVALATMAGVTETLEEGATQFVQNVAARPYTGTELSAGVGTAAAMGTVTGGGMAAGVQAVGALGSRPAIPSVDDDAAGIDPTAFVNAGALDYTSYRAAVGERLQSIATDTIDRGGSPEAVAARHQEIYDQFLDRSDKWAAFTPEQEQEFKTYLNTDWGINTNDYAPYTPTDAETAWATGDIEAVRAIGSAELLNAFRLRNGIDVNTVPVDSRDYYQAIADTMDYMAAQPRASTSQERTAQYRQMHVERIATNNKLTPREKAAISLFAFEYLGADNARMTNEQQAQMNTLRRIAAQAEDTDYGITQQDQTDPQPTGAGAVRPTDGQSAGRGATAGGQGAAGASLSAAPVGQPDNGAERGVGAQSAGNDTAQQAPLSSSAPVAPATGGQPDSRDVRGASQINPTGITGNTGAPASTGEPLAVPGNTGQNVPAGQPSGQTNAAAASQAGGGRSVGATPTERDPNSGGQEAPAQATNVTPARPTSPALVPGATLADAAEAFEALTSRQKDDLRSLAGEGASIARTEAAIAVLHRLLAEGQPAITRQLIVSNTAPSVRARRTQAVYDAAAYIMSPERVMARMEASDRAAIANAELVPAIAAADTGLSRMKTSSLSALARKLYGVSSGDSRTDAARLIADVAGAPVSAPELLDIVLEAKGAEAGVQVSTAHIRALRDALTTLRSTGVIPDSGLMPRADMTQDQVDIASIEQVLADVSDTEMESLVRVSKALAGAGQRNGVRPMVKVLLDVQGATSRGAVARFLNNRMKRLEDAAAMYNVLTRVNAVREQMPNSDAMRLENILRTADTDVYRGVVHGIVRDMVMDADSTLSRNRGTLFKAVRALSGENVVSSIPDTPGGVGINWPVVADVIADSLGYASRMGEQYLPHILREYGGVNLEGALRVSETANSLMNRIAHEVKAAMVPQVDAIEAARAQPEPVVQAAGQEQTSPEARNESTPSLQETINETQTTDSNRQQSGAYGAGDENGNDAVGRGATADDTAGTLPQPGGQGTDPGAQGTAEQRAAERPVGGEAPQGDDRPAQNVWTVETVNDIVGDGTANDIVTTKNRIKRLQRQAKDEKLSLNEKAAVKKRIQDAEARLRSQRVSIFDVEAAIAAVLDSGDLQGFDQYSALFPKAYARLRERLAAAGATPTNRFTMTLSASTGTIPGMARLQRIIDDPDSTAEQRTQAGEALNNIAYEHLIDLTADIDGLVITRNNATGLYGGAVEPSLIADVEVTDDAMPQLRAAIVRFASNFNQEQVHLREFVNADMSALGNTYDDGSFNTVTYRITLGRTLSMEEIRRIIDESGLFGLTVYPGDNGSILEMYYYGDPTDRNGFDRFIDSATRAASAAGADGARIRGQVSRAWFYSDANTTQPGVTIPYSSVNDELRTSPQRRPNQVTTTVARTLNANSRGYDQRDITPEQRALQNSIAGAYERLPLYDLDNPLVRRAYEALAEEVREQFLAMPLRRVELLVGQGEPYANSTEMREDVRTNNRIKVYATTPDSFGSDPSVDYSLHPLMRDSGLADINGRRMVMNDLFRAVHDYYAHTMSPVEFGPKGEEAAWKNHMSMMRSPWAAWALTTETRGQNSWVNFRDGVEGIPLQDRPFADQKTALLPIDMMLSGEPELDALVEQLRGELTAAEQQGSLAGRREIDYDTLTDAQVEVAFNNAGLTTAEKNALWADESVQPVDEYDTTTPVQRLTTFIRQLVGDMVDPEGTLQASATEKMRSYIASTPDIEARATQAEQARAERDAALLEATRLREAAQRARTSMDIIADTLDDTDFDAVDAFLTDNSMDSVSVTEFLEDTLTATQTGQELTSLQSRALRALKSVFDKLMDALRSFAFVSVAIAGLAGSTMFVSPQAQAAVDMTPMTDEIVMTSAAKNTLDQVIAQGDNEGRPFIIADKKGGALHIMNGDGMVVATTPALFGKDMADGLNQSGVTPAGRFDLEYNTDARLPEGYQGSVQAFNTSPTGDLFAIHRVLDVPGQERDARLASTTAKDNRITMGCINIPAEIYDRHLDGDTGAVLYVLPDTSGWDGSLFSDPARHVEPAMQGAQRAPMIVTAEQVRSAPSPESVVYPPVAAQAPLVIEGVAPSTQTAYIAPVVIGGVSFDELSTDITRHTPAELMANGVFDTAPITATAQGNSMADLAVAIVEWAALAGAGAAVYSGAKRLRSRKRRRQELAAQREAARMSGQDNGATIDSAEDLQAEVDAVRDEMGGTTPALSAPPSRPAREAILGREAWMEFINSSSYGVNTDGETDANFAAVALNFDAYLASILSDQTYVQVQRGDFDDSRRWRVDETDPTRSGIISKFMNIAAGATAVFDNWAKAHGVKSVGHESDSSVATVALAGIKSRAAGARSYIHRHFVEPMDRFAMLVASKTRGNIYEIENDIGRLATVEHVLREAATAHFVGMQKIITERRRELANVSARLTETPATASIRPALVELSVNLQKEIDRLTEARQAAMDAYEGRTEWNPDEVKLPGGYTRATAEKVVADLRTKYGDNFGLIEEGRQRLVAAIRGARKFATAHGVYDNQQLQVLDEIGFNDYVPLYREQQDPRDTDETDSYTRTATIDRLIQSLPRNDMASMGLTKDLSSYYREGAASPAADGYTNFRVFVANMAGRIGQKRWEDVVQQMYEGTTGRDISASVIEDEEQLEALNQSHSSGAIPGLIRIRPGEFQYLDAETKDKLKAIHKSGGEYVRPIVAKGYNKAGQKVTYHYYFTERAIQQDIYASTEITDTLSVRALRNVASLTRLAARLMTTYKPVWNAINMARDIPERWSIMMSRPVKDVQGNKVSRRTLTTNYARNLARLAGSLKAQQEIYRYIAVGETSTPLQMELREAEQSGAITLLTSLTARHNIMNELQRSEVDKLARRVADWLGTTANKTGLRGPVTAGADALEWYVQRLTEVPQVVVALAAYKAYRDSGVNRTESANRVRDQYDPLRVQNRFVANAGTMYPFIRSTLSGHYNVTRTLTEYWRPGEWQGQAAYLGLGTAAAFMVMTMAAAFMGDDEDGVPRVARLPIGMLVGGIPIPVGDDGIRTLPVGFGVPKIMWATAANMFKLAAGQQKTTDAMVSMLGVAIDNTSPIPIASGGAMANNPVAGIILSSTPLLLQPLVESAFNTKSFGGGRVYTRETAPNQRDSDVDDFNTPETYKRWAKSIYAASGGLFDVRPESIRHALESYSYGPFKAIPMSVISDKKEKTLGVQSTKGDEAGALITALGADIGWSPNALKDEAFTWRLLDVQRRLHRRYGVPDSHSDETYARYGVKKGKGQAAVLTEIMLREKGASEQEIQYVLNSMKFVKDRRSLQKDFRDMAMVYLRKKESGEDDPQLRAQVEALGAKLLQLNNDYLEVNSRAFLDLSVQ